MKFNNFYFYFRSHTIQCRLYGLVELWLWHPMSIWRDCEMCPLFRFVWWSSS